MTAHAPAPLLTPHGRLLIELAQDAPELSGALRRRLEESFARGAGHGLLQLGAAEVGTVLPPAWGYWREFGARYVAVMCALTEAEEYAQGAPISVPPEQQLATLASAAPPMTGAEYLTASVLRALWQELDAVFRAELAESKLPLQDFLKRSNPAWNLVGRVHFNLAEIRKDEAAPFAFLATYTTRLSAHAKAQHLPLGQALREYAGTQGKARLLSLLVPVQRAAEHCAWLHAMVEEGEIFHPLRWTPAEAWRFLTDVPRLEAAGIVVRAPRAWARAARPAPRSRRASETGRRRSSARPRC